MIQLTLNLFVPTHLVATQIKPASVPGSKGILSSLKKISSYFDWFPLPLRRISSAGIMVVHVLNLCDVGVTLL